MDVSALSSQILPAPRAVFDRLPTHRHRVRFQVRTSTGWEPVTWGQFALQIRGVARYLIEPRAERGDRIDERGEAALMPGERVAIFANNSVAWASAALGAQTAGAVFVPIYPASTPDQIAYILEHAEVKFVFVAGKELTARLDKACSLIPNKPRVIDLAQASWAAAPLTDDTSIDCAPPSAPLRGPAQPSLAIDCAPPSAPLRGPAQPSLAIQAAAARDAAAPTLVDARLGALDLDQPCQMLYTSGTSGNPKGVPLTHRNVGRNGADWLDCNAPLLEEGDRDLLWLPMSHIFGWGELCAGNLLGWETYLTSPAEVLDLLPGVAPQVFMSVPAYWEKIARAIGPAGRSESAPLHLGAGTDDPGEALRRVTGGRLRFCLSGGAGLKVEIKELLHKHGVLVIEGYGLTETSPSLTLNRPDAYRFDTVGKPLPSVELKLDTDGEILARGENVFTGYFKDPDATAAAFTEDGWFRTGDIGRWTEDGFLQIIDRKKDILVTAGGKNIPPVNIETKFVDDPVIERLVVYGDARPYLVAAVWIRSEVPPDERAHLVAARIDAINANLARHETIKRHFVAEQPLTVEDGTLTSSLKLRRKAVYDRLRVKFEALYV